MGKTILLALIAGGGGGVSLGLLSPLTKWINPQGKYSLAVLLCTAVFLLASAIVVAALVASNAVARSNVLVEMYWLIGSVIVSGVIAGVLLPLGVFGFWLAFASLAFGIAIAVRGFSASALKGCLGGIAGLIAGGIAATTWGPGSEQFEGDLGSRIIAGSISNGLIVFGITIGLLMSLEKKIGTD